MRRRETELITSPGRIRTTLIGGIAATFAVLPVGWALLSGSWAGTAALGGALAALTCWWGAERSRDANLAESTLVLASLALAGAVVWLAGKTNGGPTGVPMLRGLVIAWALAAGATCHLGKQSASEGAPRSDFWRGPLHRVTLTNLALALLTATLLAVWPRLPGIVEMDHDLTSFCAGVGANLFLLLIILWASRIRGGLLDHAMGVLAMAILIGFVVVRMLPFAHRIMQ